jgi:two-component sensor histidine kinase
MIARDGSGSRRRPAPLRAARLAAVLTLPALLAVAVVGWGLGVGGLANPLDAEAGMAPSTSITLVVAAFGLARWGAPAEARRSGRRATALCGVAVMALPVLNYLARLADGAFLDHAVWPSAAEAGIEMSPATALLSMLLGATLWVATRPRLRRHVTALASAGFAFSAFGMLGYPVQGTSLYSQVFRELSLPTATALAVLFAGALVHPPRAGWIAELARPAPAARHVRRVALALALGPAALSLAALQMRDVIERGTGLEPFDTRMLVSGLAVLVSAGGLWLHARHARRAAIDARIKAAQTARLADLAADRAMLIAELRHRSVNNLQQIVGLIELEQAKGLASPAQEALDRLRGRVMGISRVQTLLDRSLAEGAIDLADMLRRLCAEIDASHGLAARGVTLDLSAEALRVTPATAQHVALLANELLANAVKHAFRKGGGHLRVGFARRPEGGFALVVADAPHDPAPADPAPLEAGVGLLICKGLARKLGGAFEQRREGGMRVSVSLPPEIALPA